MLRGVTTVGRLESLLNTQYYIWTAATRNVSVARCDGISLPAEIKALVAFIGPSTRFPSSRTPRVEAAAPGSSSLARQLQSGQTPTTLRALYGVGTTTATQAKSQQVATGYLGEYASATDLATFFTSFYPASNGKTFNTFGPNVPGNPGVEANLDVQYIMAMGANVNTTFWYTPGQNVIPDNEPYAEFLANFTALSDAVIPKVLSTSYGGA